MNRVEHNIQSLEDVQAIEHLDFHDEVQCESHRCVELGRTETHRADWYVRLDKCGHVYAWCQLRLSRYIKLGPEKFIKDTCGVGGQRIDWWIPVRPT